MPDRRQTNRRQKDDTQIVADLIRLRDHFTKEGKVKWAGQLNNMVNVVQEERLSANRRMKDRRAS